jgi:hypothetical protein
MLTRLSSALLLLSAHLASAALPEADKLVEELSAAHAKLPGYVATWHAEGEGKSLDLTIAEDHKTGSFVLHLQANGPHGKIESRQWSPDGKQVYLDSNGRRSRVACASVELEFMRGFGEVFLAGKLSGADQLFFTPTALLGASTIEAGLQMNSGGNPGWSLVAKELETAEVASDHLAFTSPKHGRLTIDRTNGMLLRQEIVGEAGERRILERTSCRTDHAAEEITRLTAGWTTLGATDIGLDAGSMKMRLQMLQLTIDAIEDGQASLEKLEGKLARKDELLAYARGSLIKSPRPVQPVPDWDKVLAKTREEAHRRWKATLPEGGAEDEKAFKKYLTEPANRTALRDWMADTLAAMDELIPLVLPQIFGPKMDDGLVAKSATGRVAKTAIETALCRAYLAAMLEEKMAAAWGERENLD